MTRAQVVARLQLELTAWQDVPAGVALRDLDELAAALGDALAICVDTIEEEDAGATEPRS